MVKDHTDENLTVKNELYGHLFLLFIDYIKEVGAILMKNGIHTRAEANFVIFNTEHNGRMELCRKSRD